MVFSSILAPSSVRPEMYAPSRGGASTASTCFFVTSVTIFVLSRGQSFLLAVVCITAVKKDCGLKRAPSQTTLGRLMSAVQSVSWVCLSIRF